MEEEDPLSLVLREWRTPEPFPALDQRVHAAYRALHRPAWYRRAWSTQVTIPVPVLVAVLLLVLAVWVNRGSRPPSPPQPATAVPVTASYMTRLDAGGFMPLSSGATQIIRSGESRQ